MQARSSPSVCCPWEEVYINSPSYSRFSPSLPPAFTCHFFSVQPCTSWVNGVMMPWIVIHFPNTIFFSCAVPSAWHAFPHLTNIQPFFGPLLNVISSILSWPSQADLRFPPYRPLYFDMYLPLSMPGLPVAFLDPSRMQRCFSHLWVSSF